MKLRGIMPSGKDGCGCKSTFGLSGNFLKILAAILMVIDHIGVILYPGVQMFRFVGRSAFPIFAFMICEGCFYTHNRLRYFLQIFSLGAITSAVYYMVMGKVYLSTPIAFSFSMVLIYLIFSIDSAKRIILKIFLALVLAGAVVGLKWLTLKVTLDYSFWGVLLPVFPSAVSLIKKESGELLLLQPLRFLSFALAALMLAIASGGDQYFSLLSLIPMAFYNGKRGIQIPKYSFYVFYPLHIAIIWLIGRFILK